MTHWSRTLKMPPFCRRHYLSNFIAWKVFRFIFYLSLLLMVWLTYIRLVPHTRVGELGQHWFRQWLGTGQATSHYHWTLRNKLQWNPNRNSNIFLYENVFEMSSAISPGFNANIVGICLPYCDLVTSYGDIDLDHQRMAYGLVPSDNR